MAMEVELAGFMKSVEKTSAFFRTFGTSLASFMGITRLAVGCIVPSYA